MITGQSIAQYRIIDKLGQGGMGVVYKAEDTTLRRTVALKFLSQERVDNEEERDGLLREARAAAQLDHPNICTVYEVGEDDGRPYIAMAFVEGDTLRRQIESSELTIPEILDYFFQICEGLQEAHDKGVIHHDIKSTNVLITPRGQVKITDFGVAHNLRSRSGVRERKPGGTVAYMAPEKLMGSSGDERSDVWSLGVLLYEMLAGKLPFQGEYDAAVLYSVVHEDPVAVSKINRATPPRLAAIVDRSLEKDPSRRYGSVSEMAADLRVARGDGESTHSGRLVPTLTTALSAKRSRRLMWAAALAIAVVLGALAWRFAGGNNGGERPLRSRSVAVLPLANHSVSGDQDFLADSMTEELITSLAKIKSLRVISRTSVMQYRGRVPDMAEVADTLNVGYVVEGAVLRDGGRVRVNVQLIETATDRTLWAESFDGQLENVLQFESDVAVAIASKVRVQVTPEERVRLASDDHVTSGAYEHYLRGKYLSNSRTRAALEEAREHFQSMIRESPNSALGYAGLAEVWILLANYGHVRPDEAWPQAKQAASKSVELGADRSEVHSTLGLIRSFYEWDWRDAEQEFLAAVEMNPGSATAHQRYGLYLSRIGRHKQAIAELDKAKELDPLSETINNALGMVYFVSRNYDRALEIFKESLAFEDETYRTYWYLGRCYLEMGRFEEAEDALKKARELSNNNPFMVAALASGCARAGHAEEVDELIVELERASKSRYVSPASWALVYSGMGENEKTFEWLNRALAERSSVLVWAKVDPAFDPLRDDPRFDTLLAAIGLAGVL